MNAPAPLGPYPLDNRDERAGRHHVLLSLLFDKFSLRRTMEIKDMRGARCLEVGGGGGGYAHLLANQVTNQGHVLAVDIDPHHIAPHPQLSTRQVDLTAEEPDLGSGWNFIHARLTLGHLPQRRRILDRLITVLAPGGVILIEDWDASRTDMVMHAPDEAARDLYTRCQVLMGAVFERAGTDRQWARQIHGAMLDAGLEDVQTQMHSAAWVGGEPGCQLVAGTVHQLYDELRVDGMRADELDEVLALLGDSRMVLAGHMLYSTSGVKG